MSPHNPNPTCPIRAADADVPAPHDRLLHGLACATAIATFPLIFMGGLVTSHHAGMSVPDWPNSYGYNMFLFPPRLWVGGIFYEHTHRLMGTVVGLLSMALCAWAWRPGRPESGSRGFVTSKSLRYLCLAVLAGVLFQGVLGGLRVVLVKLNLAIVHACFAQAFFCLTVLTAMVTSRWWKSAPDLSDGSTGRGLIVLSLILLVTVYLQLVAGATMRHYDAGLAIPDLPLTYGKFLPPTGGPELARINRLRAWDLNLDPVTLGQIWLAFTHRVGAMAVTLLSVATVGIVIWRIFKPSLVATLCNPGRTAAGADYAWSINGRASQAGGCGQCSCSRRRFGAGLELCDPYPLHSTVWWAACFICSRKQGKVGPAALGIARTPGCSIWDLRTD